MYAKQSELFKVMGVETRLNILGLLREQGPLGASQLAQALGVTPSAISQHLRILRSSGLVESKRQGYWIPYKINQEGLRECGQMLAELCGGPQQDGQMPPTASEAAPDGLAGLKEYERHLLEELRKVRASISEEELKSLRARMP